MEDEATYTAAEIEELEQQAMDEIDRLYREERPPDGHVPKQEVKSSVRELFNIYL